MHSDLPKSSLLFQRITETPSTTAVSSAACKQAYGNPAAAQVPDHVARYHNHAVGPNQCCSAVTQQIAAPASTVWSVVRRFDNPQAYKHFVKSCHVILENSVAQIPSSPEIQFVVTDLITDILVKYEGSLPDLFREGHSAVVEGFIKPVVEGIRAKEEEILRSSSKLGVSAIDEFLQLDLQKVFRSTIL